ncbi:hypothetical protein TI39_contig5829g00021 [Zymoseptoria brevis]|uniref:Uncharacterized protein n=1 Tax=Zymoseptoria brevis TaxID=1047168 RepID=A0A0F4G5V9_9PEZI|nr:hypothetical protein TI39_contig5829g00021 [Zymoseptoria brevis]
MAFITNWVTDKLAGYAATGLQAGGTLAGNAVGGVGSLVENSGRSVGQSANGVAGAIGGVGNYINGYGNGVMGAMAADGPVGGSFTVDEGLYEGAHDTIAAYVEAEDCTATFFDAAVQAAALAGRCEDSTVEEAHTRGVHLADTAYGDGLAVKGVFHDQ